MVHIFPLSSNPTVDISPLRTNTYLQITASIHPRGGNWCSYTIWSYGIPYSVLFPSKQKTSFSPPFICFPVTGFVISLVSFASSNSLCRCNFVEFDQIWTVSVYRNFLKISENLRVLFELEQNSSAEFWSSIDQFIAIFAVELLKIYEDMLNLSKIQLCKYFCL